MNTVESIARQTVGVKDNQNQYEFDSNELSSTDAKQLPAGSIHIRLEF